LENPVSPSGSMIAAEAVVPSAGHDQGRLHVLRLTGPHQPPVAVPASSGYLFSKAAWSPSGSWLFYQGPRGTLWGYRVSTRAVRSSSVPWSVRGHGRGQGAVDIAWRASLTSTAAGYDTSRW